MLYKALRPASPGSSKSYYRKVVIAEDITDLKCDVLTDTCFLLVLRSTGLKLIRVFNKGVNKPQLLDALDSTEDNIVLLYTQSPHGVVFDITKQTDDNTNQFGRIPTSIKEYHELKNKIRNG
ncbi:MAG: hypothetical protein KKF39_06980 [Nanoarchaeota archaeon]|nr:hypothetical protein [Nanoarchaeota archaeon]